MAPFLAPRKLAGWRGRVLLVSAETFFGAIVAFIGALIIGHESPVGEALNGGTGTYEVAGWLVPLALAVGGMSAVALLVTWLSAPRGWDDGPAESFEAKFVAATLFAAGVALDVVVAGSGDSQSDALFFVLVGGVTATCAGMYVAARARGQRKATERDELG